MKRLLAAAIAASALAVTAPAASAQPCVTQPGVVHACYIGEFGAAGRGAAVFVPGAYAYVLVGCYYPDGNARYYVGAGGTIGSRTVNSPVRGIPCV